MANNKYDIIVLGGGPAGIGSAINIAKKGISVLLLEQNKISQTHKTWITFDYILEKYNIKDCIRNRFSDILFSCYLGSTYSFKNTDFLYPIHEERALDILAQTARTNGAEIKEKEAFVNYHIDDKDKTITINTSKDSYRAKLAIDAMGRDSQILKSNGLYNNLLDMGCLAFFLEDVDNKNDNKMLLFDSYFPGADYFWVVPLEDDKLMAGTFFFSPLTDNNIKEKTALLKRYLKARNISGKIYDKRQGNIPLGNQKNINTPYFLSIGDSCNTPLPSSGFSFNRCLDESEILADFISTYLDNKTDITDYKKEILGYKIPAIEVHLLISDLISKSTNQILDKAIDAMSRLREDFLISFLSGTDMSINFALTASRAIINTYSLSELRMISLKQDYIKNLLDLYNLLPAVSSAQVGKQLKDFIYKLIKDI
ncbi:lycopene cyclase family protein [Elusimicrobiota bacterium]